MDIDVLLEYVSGAACGLLYSAMFLTILVTAIRRSPVGWLMLLIEYFTFFGIGAYPLLLYFNLISVPEIFEFYILKNGPPKVTTFVHIFLYGCGAYYGYFFANKGLIDKYSNKIISVAARNEINNCTAFYMVSGFSLFISGLYFYLVGFDNALLGASAARSGDFSGLAGFEQYLFLKVLAGTGMFALIFIPYMIIEDKHVKTSFVLVFLIGISIYIETVGRGAIMDSIGVLFILYCALSKNKGIGFIVFSVVFSVLAIFIFAYGKSFVASLSMFLFENKEFELIDQGSEGSQESYFFQHFAHVVYSVDAGIQSFFTGGPILPNDIILSFLGFIPSFVFSAIGLESLSYQILPFEEKFSCINSTYFPSADPCSTPPYYLGASAYFLPFVGAFVFGLIRFWIFALFESCWLKLKDRPHYLWLPYFLYLISQNLMLVIPTTISFGVFMSIVLWLILTMRQLFFTKRAIN